MATQLTHGTGGGTFSPEPFRRTPKEKLEYNFTLERLLQYEADGNRPPDGRRVIRDERMTLMAQWQTEQPIDAQVRECARVLAMWE